MAYLHGPLERLRTQCFTSDQTSHGRRKVAAAIGGGRISYDGEALLLRAANSALKLIRRIAACFTDYRDPSRDEHSVRDLVAWRLFAVVLGYDDVNDHDSLSAGSLRALALDRAEITGQSRERDRGHLLAV